MFMPAPLAFPLIFFFDAVGYFMPVFRIAFSCLISHLDHLAPAKPFDGASPRNFRQHLVRFRPQGVALEILVPPHFKGFFTGWIHAVSSKSLS